MHELMQLMRTGIIRSPEGGRQYRQTDGTSGVPGCGMVGVQSAETGRGPTQRGVVAVVPFDGAAGRRPEDEVVVLVRIRRIEAPHERGLVDEPPAIRFLTHDR